MKFSFQKRPSHLSASQGAAEKRTEPYKKYREGVSKAATQRGAKSSGGVPRTAGQQTDAVRGSLEPKDGCIACAAQILGNKWTALILRDLAEGPKRFGEFERSLTGISPRTLSQRLDDLEADSIITKKSFAEVPPRVEYTLTPKGHDLIPVLKTMAAWGTKYS